MMPRQSVLSAAFRPVTRGDQNESGCKARAANPATRPVGTLLYLPPPLSRRPTQSRQHPRHHRRAVPKRRPSRSPHLSASLRRQKRCSPSPSASSADKKGVLRAPPRPPRTKRCSPRPSASSADKKGVLRAPPRPPRTKRCSPALPHIGYAICLTRTFVPYLTSGLSLSAARRNHQSRPARSLCQPDHRTIRPQRNHRPAHSPNPLSTIQFPALPP